MCSLFNQEITIADAISKLDTNNNDYNLDLLKISAPNGDFDWTTDNAEGSVSVSNLYDKLVVKSNKNGPVELKRTPLTKILQVHIMIIHTKPCIICDLNNNNPQLYLDMI